MSYTGSFCTEIVSAEAWAVYQFAVCRQVQEDPPWFELATTNSVMHDTEQACLDAGCTQP